MRFNLGKAIVVRNLGTELLLGEPGKKDNNIITIAKDKVITVEDGNNRWSTPYVSSDVEKEVYGVCKINQTEVLYPGEELHWEPPEQLLH